MSNHGSNILQDLPKQSIDDLNKDAIIIVGPEGVGKSRVSMHLAFHLNLPVLSFNEDRRTNLKKVGYSRVKAFFYYFIGGFWRVYNYTKPYEFKIVENILKGTKKGIIDMGAGSIIFPNKEIQDKIKTLLSRFKFTFVLLPSENKDISLNYLNRSNTHLSHISPNVNEYFLDFPYEKYVQYKIYTLNRSLNCVAKEIEKIFIENK